MKGEEVEAVYNAKDCRFLVHNRLDEFEIILLDIMLPDGDGLQILNDIQEVSDIPVIIATALSGEQRVIEALNRGANDYLIKPFHPELLLARIGVIRRMVSANKKVKAEIRFSKKNVFVDEISRRVLLNDNEVDFSSYEFDIFLLLLKNRGMVVSRNQLYKLSKGKSRHSADRTIDMQISKIRKKIDLETEIKTIWGKGYLLTDENLY